MQRTRKTYRQSRRKNIKKKGGSWLWDKLTGRKSQRSWLSIFRRKSNLKNTNSNTDHDSYTGLPYTPENITIKVLNSTNEIDDGIFEFSFDKHKKVSELKKEIYENTGIQCDEHCKLYQIFEKKMFLLDDKKTVASQDKQRKSKFVVAIQYKNHEFDYLSQLDQSIKRRHDDTEKERHERIHEALSILGLGEHPTEDQIKQSYTTKFNQLSIEIDEKGNRELFRKRKELFAELVWARDYLLYEFYIKLQ